MKNAEIYAYLFNQQTSLNCWPFGQLVFNQLNICYELHLYDIKLILWTGWLLLLSCTGNIHPVPTWIFMNHMGCPYGTRIGLFVKTIWTPYCNTYGPICVFMFYSWVATIGPTVAYAVCNRLANSGSVDKTTLARRRLGDGAAYGAQRGPNGSLLAIWVSVYFLTYVFNMLNIYFS